ncbi:hypothetical protein [Deinococcus altitudinis]|uniref:hypothetical protein n=1 Tax=Deinococcus altitudinis TaxID=468914 RepID=UPI0038923AF5
MKSDFPQLFWGLVALAAALLLAAVITVRTVQQEKRSEERIRVIKSERQSGVRGLSHLCNSVQAA